MKTKFLHKVVKRRIYWQSSRSVPYRNGKTLKYKGINKREEMLTSLSYILHNYLLSCFILLSQTLTANLAKDIVEMKAFTSRSTHIHKYS